MNGFIHIIEDDSDMCDMLDIGLERRGFKTASYQSGAKGLQAISNHEVDVILTDVNLPDIDGMKICQTVMAEYPDIPVVMMTAFGNMEMAIDAMRAGAYDFITKPVDMDILALALERAVQHRMLKNKLKILSKKVEDSRHLDDMLGESQVMKDLFNRLARISDTETSVLITGESGSGKELTARSLHRHSRRSGKPFIAVNCSALPETLLESELFGHVKGAFTGADNNREGLLQEANGGTLFLDEVGDMPLSLQPKILRAIEERSARPLGGNTERSFDIRILAATNHDLDLAVKEGSFREDLFYRLNVINIHLPPLRKRGTDSLLLAKKFLQDFAGKQNKHVTGIATTAAKKILSYYWPGNIRELRNAMEHAVALTSFNQIQAEDLPAKVADGTGSQSSSQDTEPQQLVSLEEMTNRYIARVLEFTEGNQSLAAQILGIDRKTLYRRLHKSSGPPGA